LAGEELHASQTVRHRRRRCKQARLQHPYPHNTLRTKTTTVSTRPDAAAARKLLVVPAGAPVALLRIAPNLAALGCVLPAVGEEPEKANVLKLTGNFMVGKGGNTACVSRCFSSPLY
jgi:hypothetical protein